MITTTPIQDAQPENPKEYFKGYWVGIFIGLVTGAGLAVLLLKA